ncbi:MAG: hypothetical protein AB1689_07605 [Thermodesulfobacteriota bacterium]
MGAPSRRRRTAAGALLAVALLLVPGAAARAGWPFAGVVLEDPDGKRWDLDDLAGKPVLVAVADRAGSAQAVAWGRGIAKLRPQGVAAWATAGKVAILSIADLRAVPGFARGAARWAIDAMVDEQAAGAKGPPLLLDWEGEVAGPVEPRGGVANLRLYDASGTVVLRDEGEPTPEKLERLATKIDELLAASAATPGVPGASAAAPRATPAAAAVPGETPP